MIPQLLLCSVEEQLQIFGKFLNEYEQKLASLLCKSPTDKPGQGKLLKEPLVVIDYNAAQEKIALLRLLESDRALNKTLLTFTHLCYEIEALTIAAEKKQLKFLYIDEDLLAVEVDAAASTAAVREKQVLLKMSEHIEFICQVQFLVHRLILLGNNLLHQCGAYLAAAKDRDDLKFYDVFDYIAVLLQNLVIFDEIFRNSNFTQYWAAYKNTIASLAQRTSNLDLQTNASQANGLENAVLVMDSLVTGMVFRSFLDSLFSLKEKIGPKGMGHLQQQLNEYIRMELQKIEKFSQNGDLNDLIDTKLLVRTNAMAVVFHDFVGQIEQKHVKHLLELNNKHHGVMLFANIPWQPMDFLKKHAASLLKSHEKLLAQDLKRLQRAFLTQRIATVQRDCRQYCTTLALWTLHLNRLLQKSAFEVTLGEFSDVAGLLIKGLEYAGKISYLVKALISTHVSLQMPMTRTTLLAVCKMIELLKVLQGILQSNTAAIAEIMQSVWQFYQYQVLELLNLCKKKIISSKLHDRNVDSLAAIKVAEKALAGPATFLRLFITKLALNVSNTAGRLLSAEQMEKFKMMMEYINLLANYQVNLQSVCNTTFLYWHQAILSAYMKQIIERRMDFNCFQQLIATADDSVKILEMLQLGDLTITDALKRSNFEQLRGNIISNLCAQIETFLRLEVHSNLQLDKMLPFEQGINDYRDLIDMCPLELNGHYVVLKDHVENYLSAMFYNLTTISLHDWKTYEDMRHLANNRLFLQPIDDYLPNQTLEQGVDILEIMRNIHTFVSKYSYDLNCQVFLEQKSNNKYLESINITHVANSLRTHGTGVINTSVNFTYQFLRQKFYTFSQFLFDEQIKSRLMKEQRAFSERKEANTSPLYRYERADAFNKEIRKLGLSGDGQTYMDLFRKVITHVGNAMGYIRLIRSGCIRANYSCSLYLPNFDEGLQFVEMTEEAGLSDVSKQAAQNVESNINYLVKNFLDEVDYFKLLLEAFQPFFRNPQNLHLKNFYLIIPPLTVNYIEHMLSAKEKIGKKDCQDALFFDDGFAVGLAYILKLLDQVSNFNSLQWFETVRERFDAERQKIKEMLADIQAQAAKKISKNDTQAMNQKTENEKLQQTLALTERRINTHQQEFNLFYYKLNSAKIFYQ